MGFCTFPAHIAQRSRAEPRSTRCHAHVLIARPPAPPPPFRRRRRRRRRCRRRRGGVSLFRVGCSASFPRRRRGGAGRGCRPGTGSQGGCRSWRWKIAVAASWAPGSAASRRPSPGSGSRARCSFSAIDSRDFEASIDSLDTVISIYCFWL